MRNRKILLATTSGLEGFAVDRYLGVVSAQFVVGSGLFTDFFSSWTDFFGAHSGAYESKLDRINEEALDQITARATALGANAVIGLRVDHDEIAGGSKSMLMVTASGTAVRIRRKVEQQEAEADLDGIVSAAALILEGRKQRLLAKFRGEYFQFDDDTWDFITEHRMAEAAPFVLSKIEQIAALPDSMKTSFESRAQAYVLALQSDVASELLYNAALGETENPEFFRRAIQSAQLLDLPRIIDAITRDPQREGRRALQLIPAHTPIYDDKVLSDLERLKESVERLCEHKAPIVEKSKLIGSGVKRLWQCECGKENDLDSSACSTCAKDQYGFPSGSITPPRALEIIRWRIETVRSLRRSGFQAAGV